MRWGHAVAGIAALALVIISTGVDWYGTAQGDEARRIEEITDEPSGAEGGEIDRRLNEDASVLADEETDKAWEADGLVDRIILALIAGSVLLAVLTWFTRAAGGKPTQGLGPAGMAALLSTAAAVLVAYRIVQEPGLDQATNVKVGAPLALLALAAIAIGSSSALRADAEEEESADAGAA